MAVRRIQGFICISLLEKQANCDRYWYISHKVHENLSWRNLPLHYYVQFSLTCNVTNYMWLQ